MVVADDDALARIFAAHDVAGDGLGHDACVREGEIFSDYAAPAVGSKFNRSHKQEREVYAKRTLRQQPDWPVVGGRTASEGGPYKSFLSFCSSSHFTIFPTSWARSRGQMRRASGVSTTIRSCTPITAVHFPGHEMRLPRASRA